VLITARVMINEERAKMEVIAEGKPKGLRSILL
jgi:hypothetical protein